MSLSRLSKKTKQTNKQTKKTLSCICSLKPPSKKLCMRLSGCETSRRDCCLFCLSPVWSQTSPRTEFSDRSRRGSRTLAGNPEQRLKLAWKRTQCAKITSTCRLRLACLINRGVLLLPALGVERLMRSHLLSGIQTRCRSFTSFIAVDVSEWVREGERERERKREREHFGLE